MGYDCGPYASCTGFVRRFTTREERTARLRRYADALEQELQAVKERIAAEEAP